MENQLIKRCGKTVGIMGFILFKIKTFLHEIQYILILRY